MSSQSSWGFHIKGSPKGLDSFSYKTWITPHGKPEGVTTEQINFCIYQILGDFLKELQKVSLKRKVRFSLLSPVENFVDLKVCRKPWGLMEDITSFYSLIKKNRYQFSLELSEYFQKKDSRSYNWYPSWTSNRKPRAFLPKYLMELWKGSSLPPEDLNVLQFHWNCKLV